MNVLYYYILNFFIPQSAESKSENKRKTNAMTTEEKPKVIRESDKNERSKPKHTESEFPLCQHI
jgi:hypothetical protein